LRTLTAVLLFIPLVCFAQSGSIAGQLAEGKRAIEAGKWDVAIESYRQVRSSAQTAGDAKSEAAALAGMAEAEYGLSHDDLADKLARESLQIAEDLRDGYSIAAALRQIGSVQYRRGQLKEVQKTNERILAIQTDLGDRKAIAVALNNVGSGWRNLGEPLRAIDYLSQAENEFAALGDGRSRAVVLNNIGNVYVDLGDYDRGLDFGRQGLALSEAAKDDTHIGTALNDIAVTEMYRGNYREALRIYQKAMDASRRAGNLWSQAEVANNIGLVYRAQQNHEQAVAYFKQTLEMNRKVGSKDLASDAHSNLGDEMVALRRLPEAMLHFRECLRLSEETADRDVASEAHRGLGTAFFLSNRLAEAEVELLAAAAIQRELLDSPNLAQTWVELSRLRLKQGRFNDALDQARESIQLLASIDKPEILWQAQLATGRALRALGRNDDAARSFEASMTTIESLRLRVAGPPTALPVYFADKLEPYRERVTLALAAGQTEAALRFAEQSKSRALGDILRSGRTDLGKSLTPDEREAEHRLKIRLAGLDIRIANHQNDDAQLQSERDRARRELEALESDLYAAHPETALQRGEFPALTIAETAQLAVDTGAVILNYFVTPENAWVFVIRRGASTRVVSLGMGQAALSARATEFHRQLAAHDLNYATAAQALYRTLLAPVEHDLTGQRAVVFLPDGPLWDVAFQALQPAPRRFLIEQVAVSYSPSLAVLRETMRLARKRRATPVTGELLALGNPAGRDPLPEAERQVRELEKLYGPQQSRVLIGDAASEGRFKSEAGNYRVLHLASHAVLDGVNPMYSHALLARTANDAGMLEARELMNFNLHAELLVLSACETARGRAVGGEGISGMLWAAFVAGAPTTVASLWRVESASTSDLMVGFHRNWLAARHSGDPFAKPVSLQQAARSLIAGGTWSHPFYWAGFIVMGSPE
jgi:CHAT domain-containing protein